MWNELLNDFLLDYSSDWSRSTQKWYGQRLGPFIQYLRSNQINAPPKLSPRHVARYMAMLRQAGASWSSRNGFYTACGAFVRWLSQTGEIETNFFANANEVGLKRPRKPRKEIRTIKLEHIKQMINCAEEKAQQGDIIAIRDVVVMRMMIETGLRRGELVELRVTDVDLETGEVFVVGKYGHERYVYLQVNTCRAIERWLKARPPSPDNSLIIGLQPNKKGLFQSIRGESVNDIVKKWRANSGLPDHIDVAPHSWRRTFATKWRGDAYVLQKILGHEHIETTMSYVKREKQDIKRESAIYTPMIDD